MQHIFTLLLQDDIKQTRLVRALERLGIEDVSSLSSNASAVIFELLEINRYEEKEALLDSYHKQIELASSDDKTNESEHISYILTWLNSLNGIEL